MYLLAPNQQIEKYPYSIGMLRKENPNTSFPRKPSDDLLETWNVFRVQHTQQPEYDPSTQNIKEDAPVLQEGVWKQVWAVTDASLEEIEERRKSLVPQSITPLQARLQINKLGLREQVELAVQSSQDVQDYWEYASTIERNHPLLIELGTALGLTDKELDEAFIAASQL